MFVQILPETFLDLVKFVQKLVTLLNNRGEWPSFSPVGRLPNRSLVNGVELDAVQPGKVESLVFVGAILKSDGYGMTRFVNAYEIWSH